jgi:hypothetical protein
MDKALKNITKEAYNNDICLDKEGILIPKAANITSNKR